MIFLSLLTYLIPVSRWALQSSYNRITSLSNVPIGPFLLFYAISIILTPTLFYVSAGILPRTTVRCVLVPLRTVRLCTLRSSSEFSVRLIGYRLTPEDYFFHCLLLPAEYFFHLCICTVVYCRSCCCRQVLISFGLTRLYSF